jgi:hypothetical protein
MHDSIGYRLKLWKLFNPVNKRVQFVITRNKLEERNLLNGPDKYVWQYVKIHFFSSMDEINAFFRDMSKYKEMFKKEGMKGGFVW